MHNFNSKKCSKKSLLYNEVNEKDQAKIEERKEDQVKIEERKEDQVKIEERKEDSATAVHQPCGDNQIDDSDIYKPINIKTIAEIINTGLRLTAF